MKKKRRAPVLALGILAVILVIGLCMAFAKAGDLSAARLQAGLGDMDPEAAARLDTELIGHTLGLLSLLVPTAAVALAFITREVVSSLFASLIYGHLMLGAVAGFSSESVSSGVGAYLVGTLDGSLRSLIATVCDPESAAVIILCLVLGGLIALINQTGAFRTLAVGIIQRIKSPKHAYLMAEFLGLAVFFDDYANSLIVGPVMRPVTDRLGISREKLAYIVDSTAAPVSSIAIISSWVATEVAAIKTGLAVAGAEESAYNIFLSSIPYNFYNILALVFIFIGSLMMREYGPMLRAEVRARRGQPLRPGSAWRDEMAAAGEGAKDARTWVGVLPIALLCAFAFAGFYLNGYQNALLEGAIPSGAAFTLQTLLVALGSADTIFIILEASLIASVLALLFGRFSGSFRFTNGLLAWQQGASGLLPTVMILVIAWSLSGVITQMGAVYYLVDIITLGVPHWLVPSLVFLTCCLISFGIGSYGCMAIMVPMVIPIAYGVIANTPAMGDAWQFLVTCVACVLSGSVFGDHCSPITDTTILSSMGAGCDNIDHAKTQLPYAITIALIATVSGTLLAGLGVRFWFSYPIAILLIIAVFLLVGKNPDKIAKNQNIFKQ